MQENLIYISRILIAALCGMFVGLERNKRQKDAGIRTHMIVSIGAALMMIVSKYGFTDLGEIGMKATDASRVAAQIVSGVGFLGAGVIFVNHKQSIKGLTTAAGIWAVAGVGMSVGAGMYVLGVVSSVIIVVLQYVMHVCFTKFDNTETEEISIELINDKAYMTEFLQGLENAKIEISDLRISKEDDKGVKLQFFVKAQNDTFEKLLEMVWENEKVVSFSI